MQHAFSKSTGLTFRASRILETAERATYQRSIYLRAASPVSHTVRQVNDRVPLTSAIFGPNFTASFANLNQDGCWLKMYQGYSQMTLDGFSEVFCETWMRAGMMR